MKSALRYLTMLCLLLSVPAWAQPNDGARQKGAADYAREKRWAEEVEPGIVTGEAVYLSANGRNFLSIFTPAEAATAAAIVVHGLGVHPDWNLIGALRTSLADQGYTTLSIQMPVLDAEKRAEAYPPTFPEARARLAAAAKYLQDKGFKKIALVAHSMGARMADNYLAKGGQAPIAAFVPIGLNGKFEAPAKLAMPVLDLYGSDDFPRVIDSAKQRQKQMGGKNNYRQQVSPATDHFFNGKDAELVKFVKAFLDAELK